MQEALARDHIFAPPSCQSHGPKMRGPPRTQARQEFYEKLTGAPLTLWTPGGIYLEAAQAAEKERLERMLGEAKVYFMNDSILARAAREGLGLSLSG
jgi:hypothetical protein